MSHSLLYPIPGHFHWLLIIYSQSAPVTHSLSCFIQHFLQNSSVNISFQPAHSRHRNNALVVFFIAAVFWAFCMSPRRSSCFYVVFPAGTDRYPWCQAHNKMKASTEQRHVVCVTITIIEMLSSLWSSHFPTVASIRDVPRLSSSQLMSIK